MADLEQDEALKLAAKEVASLPNAMAVTVPTKLPIRLIQQAKTSLVVEMLALASISARTRRPPRPFLT